MCILVLKPPRERPSFSSTSPPFFHQRREGSHESRCHRRNEPDNLVFLVCPHRLVGVLRLAAKYRLFAIDKTVLRCFPTFHNVHRRSRHGAPVRSYPENAVHHLSAVAIGFTCSGFQWWK